MYLDLLSNTIQKERLNLDESEKEVIGFDIVEGGLRYNNNQIEHRIASLLDYTESVTPKAEFMPKTQQISKDSSRKSDSNKSK